MAEQTLDNIKIYAIQLVREDQSLGPVTYLWTGLLNNGKEHSAETGYHSADLSKVVENLYTALGNCCMDTSSDFAMAYQSVKREDVKINGFQVLRRPLNNAESAKLIYAHLN